MRPLSLLSFALAFLLPYTTHAEESATQPVVIYAASSLTDALNDIAQTFERQTHVHLNISYASSSTLARQITQGATADLFISADQQWMDDVEHHDMIDATSRAILLRNDLVMVAAKSAGFTPQNIDAHNLAQLDVQHRIATGEVTSVPAGMYAKQALSYFGQWQHYQPKLVETENVRAALTLVLRGEVDLAIVYATDAAQFPYLDIIGTFPAASHDDIAYPIALTRQHQHDAEAVYHFLRSAEAQQIFARYGFQMPQKSP
jgi:molybdate transport system substrate-binding protein